MDTRREDRAACEPERGTDCVAHRVGVACRQAEKIAHEQAHRAVLAAQYQRAHLEVVVYFGGGLVVPVGQSDPLASALEEVLMAIGDWRAAAAEAGVRVRSWFGEETVCRRLERVYEEVTSGAAAEQVA